MKGTQSAAVAVLLLSLAVAHVHARGQARVYGVIDWDRNRGDAIISVRNLTAAPATPDVCYTEIGITKLNSTGNRTVEALLKLAASR